MASMSRNSSASSNALMGFSVHQPEIGAPLRFFPAVGTQELDDLVDSYIPGPYTNLEKRAAVSMEFFNYSIQTGELYKFFFIYPQSAATSPASPSTLQDSGYGSFSTSPVISESQWTQSVSPPASSGQHKVQPLAKKATVHPSRSTSDDFSHMPGMKILTKDGRDITHTATRGCKTKEQRDHAHLMRVLKACDECKRKKVRCDPSHKKRRLSLTSPIEARTTKKTKKTQVVSPPAAVTSTPEQNITPTSASVDMSSTDPFSLEECLAVSNNVDEWLTSSSVVDDWTQFVHWDKEPSSMMPVNHDWPVNATTHSSPTTTSAAPVAELSVSGTGHFTSTSHPSRVESHLESSPGEARLPYMNSDFSFVGSDYTDFNLYSPASSFLDDEPHHVMELSAAPIPQPSRNASTSQWPNYRWGDSMRGNSEMPRVQTDDATADDHLQVSSTPSRQQRSKGRSNIVRSREDNVHVFGSRPPANPQCYPVTPPDVNHTEFSDDLVLRSSAARRRTSQLHANNGGLACSQCTQHRAAVSERHLPPDHEDSHHTASSSTATMSRKSVCTRTSLDRHKPARDRHQSVAIGNATTPEMLSPQTTSLCKALLHNTRSAHGPMDLVPRGAASATISTIHRAEDTSVRIASVLERHAASTTVMPEERSSKKSIKCRIKTKKQTRDGNDARCATLIASTIPMASVLILGLILMTMQRGFRANDIIVEGSVLTLACLLLNTLMTGRWSLPVSHWNISSWSQHNALSTMDPSCSLGTVVNGVASSRSLGSGLSYIEASPSSRSPIDSTPGSMARLLLSWCG